MTTPISFPHIESDFSFSSAQSLSLALENAVTQQQRNAIAAQSATLLATTQILDASAPAARNGSAENAPQATSGASAFAPPPAKTNGKVLASHSAGIPLSNFASPAGTTLIAAQQFVAQTIALTVLDGAISLSNLRTLYTAAIGRLLAQLVSGGDLQGLGGEINAAQGILTQGLSEFYTVSKYAAQLLEEVQGLGKPADPVPPPQFPASPAAEAHEADGDEALAHALSVAAENAVIAQQQNNMIGEAALVHGISTMDAVVTAANGVPDSESPEAPKPQSAEPPAAIQEMIAAPSPEVAASVEEVAPTEPAGSPTEPIAESAAEPTDLAADSAPAVAESTPDSAGEAVIAEEPATHVEAPAPSDESAVPAEEVIAKAIEDSATPHVEAAPQADGHTSAHEEAPPQSESQAPSQEGGEQPSGGSQEHQN